MDFAAFLRNERESIGISTTELAEYLGCSRRTIYNWEHDVYQPKRFEQILALAEFFKVPHEEILRHLGSFGENKAAAP